MAIPQTKKAIYVVEREKSFGFTGFHSYLALSELKVLKKAITLGKTFAFLENPGKCETFRLSLVYWFI